VNRVRTPLAVLGIAAVSCTAGCLGTRPPRAPPPAPPAAVPPAPVARAGGEVIPKAEPKSRYGNPPFYDVFGKRYYVLSSSADYVERGVASWYGPGFHQVKTSSGELYDMYGMSAAHRTLPLPAYVRVTNLQNGRSVVVRVNDRGPFVGNRIIDLSYTAAAKLDMLRDGTAMVEVRSLDVGAPPPTTTLTAAAPPVAAPTATAATAAPTLSLIASAEAAPVAAAPEAPATDTPTGVANAAVSTTAVGPGAEMPTPASAAKPVLFVQAGAFADPANAERLAAKLRGGSYGRIFVRDDVIAGRKLYRVRIGPVADVQSFDRIYAALERDGVHDAHLAMD
jgi:rare lipoprotein A